jgi:dihydroxyacetone kinase-like protein
MDREFVVEDLVMDSALKKALIEDCAKMIIAHAEELTSLDQAIGDGDHGVNMKRGFESILADADSLAARPLPDMMKAIGTQLVMKVGGASGPLYGTLFLTLAKEISDQPTAENLKAAFAAAFEAVKARGKSEVGQKTMLDVFAPVLAAWDNRSDLASHLSETARLAAEATVSMKAIRGRASFLGDRSIGHMDPGARSSSLLIATIAKHFGA